MYNKPYKNLKLLIILMNTCFIASSYTFANPKVNNNFEPSETRSELIKIQLNSQNSSVDTQDKVDKIDDQTALALQAFQNTLRETVLTEKYNQNLSTQIKHQQQQLNTLMEQRISLVQVRQKLDPMMNNMITVLNDFIAADVPFLWQERQLRIDALKIIKNNPEITINEKIRRILEAYQIEVSYGYDIESWQESLPYNESKQLVSLLRIGRLALYYVTPDKQSGGVWDQKNRQWLPLKDSDMAKVMTAIKVANNNASPQLLSLPVVTQ